jgi:hypothetical protein
VKLTKYFSTFYETWRFITMFTKAFIHPDPYQSSAYHPILSLFRSILILSTENLILLDLIILILLGEDSKLCRSSSCTFHHPVTSSLFQSEYSQHIENVISCNSVIGTRVFEVPATFIVMVPIYETTWFTSQNVTFLECKMLILF